MDWRPISADSHITEPPGCYRDHIDAAYRERAPHVVRHDGMGDIYVVDGSEKVKFEYRDADLNANRSDKTGLEKYLEQLTRAPERTQHNTYTLLATRRTIIDIVRPTGNGYLRVGFLADRTNAFRGSMQKWLLILVGVMLVLALVGGLTLNAMAARAVDQLVSEEQEKARQKMRADLQAEQKKQQQAESRRADDAPLDSNEFFGIIDLAKKVGDTFDIENILRHAVGAIVRVLGVQEVMIFIVDETGTELRASIGHDSTGLIEPAVIHDVRVKVGQGEIGSAAEYGGTNIIDVPTPGSALVSALAARGHVIGVFRAKGKVNGKPFGKRDKLIGRQFADLIGNALYNAMLYQAAGALARDLALRPGDEAPPPIK